MRHMRLGDSFDRSTALDEFSSIKQEDFERSLGLCKFRSTRQSASRCWEKCTLPGASANVEIGSSVVCLRAAISEEQVNASLIFHWCLDFLDHVLLTVRK